MSIVNQLSEDEYKRDRLINLRNGFTYGANTMVLLIALNLFAVVENSVNAFRFLCFICLSIGALSSAFYVMVIKEMKLTETS